MAPFETIPLRNPTVPIGAISRFEAARFDGDWSVVDTAPGASWSPVSFAVRGGGTQWREGGAAPAAATLSARAPGILRLTYEDGRSRELWVLWTDPDHRTVAIGDPDGRFGLIAVRGGARADQVRAARQVLDFNGYRTQTWGEAQ